MSEREELAEWDALADWFWQHEHGHVCSNNPGGHLCGRQCVTGALLRSPWLRDLLDRTRAEALVPVLALADEWEAVTYQDALGEMQRGAGRALRAAAGARSDHATEED